MSSTLRCKPGDLAIIINDMPGGEANIGRIVEVFGPLARTEDHGPTWLIIPVSRNQYLVHEGSNIISLVIEAHHRIEHPDSWMTPIREENQHSIETDEPTSQRVLEEVL